MLDACMVVGQLTEMAEKVQGSQQELMEVMKQMGEFQRLSH
jgi:hypothetical protein